MVALKNTRLTRKFVEERRFLQEFPAFANGWRVPDRRPIYEWAADYLTLPPSYGMPGRFNVAVNRPMIAVFDAIQDPMIRRVRFRGPPRFGKSLIADIAIPWVMCNDPGPVMANFPKKEFAEQRMKEKLWPLWRSCEPLNRILPEGRFDVTTTEIYFGSFFFLAQGISPANLQGKGIRWQFNDEIWLPVWQDTYNQAVARTRDYARTKCEKVVDISQPGIENDVEDVNFREGECSVWHYRTRSGKLVPLKMGGEEGAGNRWGLVWSNDAKRADGTYNRGRVMETVRYVCRESGEEWPNTPVTTAAWNDHGEYVATNNNATPGVRSFWVNGLLNNSLGDLALRKVAAMERAYSGDLSAMRDVKQQDECEPWRETYLTVTVAEGQSGFVTADYADGAPLPGEVFRCITVDRQQGGGGDRPHRWVHVQSWRLDGCRLLWFGRVETIEALHEVIARYKVKKRCVWQDAAFERSAVFDESAMFGWIACIGSDQQSWKHEIPTKDPSNPVRRLYLPFSPWQQSRSHGRIVNYLLFSEDQAADLVAAAYSGRGVKFEVPDDILPAYREHMKAEHKVRKGGRWRWEKIYATKPNHGWDTTKMQFVFATLMELIHVRLPENETPGAAAPRPPG